MNKEIYIELEKSSFESVFNRMKRFEDVKRIIDKKSDNVSFNFLLQTALKSYRLESEKLFMEYQYYQSTISTINNLIDEKKHCEAILEKENLKKHKDEDLINLYSMKLKFHKKHYNRQKKFLDTMETFYSKSNINNLYFEITDQLKAYDDLIYYLWNHEKNDMTHNDYVVLYNSLNTKNKQKISSPEFESVYNKYLSILETKIINYSDPQVQLEANKKVYRI